MTIAKKLLEKLNKLHEKTSLEDYDYRLGDVISILSTGEYGNTGKILSYDSATELLTLEIGTEGRQIQVNIYDVESIK